MALGSALVDRARVITQTVTATKVEGSTQVLPPTVGPWFRARLTLPATPTTVNNPDNKRREVVLRPQLLCGKKDSEGGTIEITPALRIEVESAQLGHDFWEVMGDPEPLRKRRSMLGWQADLRRLENHEFASLRVTINPPAAKATASAPSPGL